MDKINKKLKIYLLLAFTVFLFSSCSIFVPTQESNLQYVFDMYGLNFNRGDKFYLKHCIWYEDPMNISAMNYLKGRVLSVGDEIEFIKSFPRYVIFKTVKNGKEYKINNDVDRTLLSDFNQFHRIFTNKNPLENVNASKKVIALLKRGRIINGMTRKQVLLAYGLPPRAFNPPMSKTTWVYFLDRQFVARHVVFNRNDKVIYVFDC
jgi:hypothetical protein